MRPPWGMPGTRWRSLPVVIRLRLRTLTESSVWDFAQNNPRKQFVVEPLNVIPISLFFSHDGKWLAVCGEHEIGIWKLGAVPLKLGKTLQWPAPELPDSMAYRPPEAKLEKTLQGPAPELVPEAHGQLTARQGLCSIAFAPDKNTLAVGRRDSEIELWNLDGHGDAAHAGSPFARRRILAFPRQPGLLRSFFPGRAGPGCCTGQQ